MREKLDDYKGITGKCPTCKSPAPHLHPATQHEGEVFPCHDAYHRQVTPENTPEKIEELFRYDPS